MGVPRRRRDGVSMWRRWCRQAPASRAFCRRYLPAPQRHANLDVRSLVLYEDNHLIVINKPSGLLCQPDRTKDCDLRSLVLTQHIPTAYLSLVHRLDRPASGCVLLAKTSKAAARLSKAFQGRAVQKLYLCAVQGRPVERAAWLVDSMQASPDAQHRSGAAAIHKAAVIPCAVRPLRAAMLEMEPLPRSAEDAYVRLHKQQLKCRDGAGGEHRSSRQVAALRYDLVHTAEDGAHSLLAVQLHTGRRHQIRAQLAAHGHAVVGDRRYGKHRHCTLPHLSQLALHAAMMRLQHPISARGELCVAAPLPTMWRDICTADGAVHELFEEARNAWDEACSDATAMGLHAAGDRTKL